MISYPYRSFPSPERANTAANPLKILGIGMVLIQYELENKGKMHQKLVQLRDVRFTDFSKNPILRIFPTRGSLRLWERRENNPLHTWKRNSSNAVHPSYWKRDHLLAHGRQGH